MVVICLIRVSSAEAIAYSILKITNRMNHSLSRWELTLLGILELGD